MVDTSYSFPLLRLLSRLSPLSFMFKDSWLGTRMFGLGSRVLLLSSELGTLSPLALTTERYIILPAKMKKGPSLVLGTI